MYLAEAIVELYPNATFGIRNGKIVEWVDEKPMPTLDSLKPTMELISKKIKFDTVKDGLEQAIADHIQSKIDEYNTANNLSFRDIDSLVKYSRIKTYSHYRFVIRTLTWNVKVWEFARQVMEDVISGKRGVPTKQELIDALPKLVY